jgi:hypothetical protein
MFTFRGRDSEGFPRVTKRDDRDMMVRLEHEHVRDEVATIKAAAWADQECIDLEMAAVLAAAEERATLARLAIGLAADNEIAAIHAARDAAITDLAVRQAFYLPLFDAIQCEPT